MPQGPPAQNAAGIWTAKRHDNRARDLRVVEALERQGWGVLTVWQCEMTDKDALINRVEEFLDSRVAVDRPINTRERKRSDNE